MALILLLFLGSKSDSYAQVTYETIPVGSFIINMGVEPQTAANALKPYGLVWDLLYNNKVPIKWVINPAKSKDGVDFTYNGTNYKGGPFIILAGYRTTEVNAKITSWQAQGVVGVTTISEVTVPVFETLNYFMRWTLDAQNGSIAQGYLTNAGIPVAGYNWVSPQNLNCCHDIFAMPHADPTWATHNRLFTWNEECKGAIWAACHAASALENSFNTANPSQQMNFLSNKTGNAIGAGPWATNSLVLWTDHSGGSMPYTHNYPTDPIMQFLGVLDGAQENGSEQIYLPELGSSWRSTSKVTVLDPTQVDVPGNSPGEAAKVVYGRGFGDSNRGFVMYEAGHTHNKGTTPNFIAAQRAFFNFSFWSVRDKQIQVSLGAIPAEMNGGQSYAFNAAASSGTGSYSFQWTSSCGGTFSSPNSAATNFTAPIVADNTPCIITCIVTDPCGRSSFNSQSVIILPGPRPPVPTNDAAVLAAECGFASPLTIDVLSNDTDPDGSTLTVTALSGNNGTWNNNGDGTVTYLASENFTGTATATYTVCDATSLCANANITVTVGSFDPNGCLPSQAYGFISTDSAYAQTNTSVTNPANALGDPDYDAADNTTYAVMNNNSDILTLDFGAINTTADSVLAYFASASNSSVTASFSYSTDGSSFTSFGTLATGANTDIVEAKYAMPISGLRYLRIQRSAGSADLRVDAATIEYWGCVDATPTAVNDAAGTLEDVAKTIDVDANDIVPAGGAHTIVVTSQPANGTAVVNVDNTITYLPDTDFSGVDNFQYSICDEDGFCATGTVTVTVQEDGCAAGKYRSVGLSSPTTVSINSSGDTYLRKDAATNNYGTNTSFEVGKRNNRAKRGILNFDVSSIPTGAVLDGATMTVNRTGGDNTALSLSAYALTQSWNETQATWNNRITATAWTTAGGTIETSPYATINSATSNGARNFDLTTLVQKWVNGTLTNNGVLVKQTDETLVDKRHIFASEEHGTSGLRPVLSVTYRTLGPCEDIANRAPLAAFDFDTTTSTVPITINVAANDFDIENGALTVSQIVGAVTGGTASITGNNILFTPTTSFNGTATFLYRVCDPAANCDTARVYIQVGNSAPFANNDTPTVASGSTTLLAVQSNDSDPEGDAFSMSLVDYPGNGTASIVGNSIQYSPFAGFTGMDTLRYVLCETAGGSCGTPGLCDTATVFISITNSPPVASNDVVSTPICQTVSIPNNDTDPENGQLTVTAIINGPSNGVATIDPDGVTIHYTPTPLYEGSDNFNYIVCDNGTPSKCDTATITVNVVNSSPNTAPVALDDSDETIQGQIIYLPVLDNDSDPDNQSIEITLLPSSNSPANGVLSLSNNGLLIIYTPNTGFVGTDDFDYQICEVYAAPPPGCPFPTPLCDLATVTVTVINQPPVGIDDEETATPNTTATYNVFDDDFDPDGNGIVLTELTDLPDHGIATFNPDGTISYTPNNGYYGTDTITYVLCDDVALPYKGCDTAIVVITVTPPIDIEVVKTVSNSAPNINDNIIYTLEATNHGPNDATGVVVTDQLPSGLMYVSDNGGGIYDLVTGQWFVGNLTNGQSTTLEITATVLSFQNSTNIATFTDADQFDSNPTNNADTVLLTCTSPSLSHLVTDVLCFGENTGEINLTVTGGSSPFTFDWDNDGPEVTDNDPEDLSNLSAGSYQVTVTDAGGCTATTTAIVDQPATGLGLSTIDMQPTCPNLNDGAINLTVSGGTPTYTFDWDNDGLETPDDDPEDLTNLTAGTYEVFVTDANGCQGSASVTLTAPDCNEPPVAVFDRDTIDEDSPLNIPILTNDSDPDGNIVPASVTIVEQPSNGTVSVNVDGSLLYVPDPDFDGLDTLVYQVCDDGTPLPSQCDTAIVYIVVSPMPDIDVTATQACDDNGTPNISTDDYFTIELTVSNPDPGANNQFRVYNGADLLATGTYGNSVTLEWRDAANTLRFLADGTSTYTLNIRDFNNSFDETTHLTTPEANCSNCPPPACPPVQLTRIPAGSN